MASMSQGEFEEAARSGQVEEIICASTVGLRTPEEDSHSTRAQDSAEKSAPTVRELRSLRHTAKRHSEQKEKLVSATKDNVGQTAPRVITKHQHHIAAPEKSSFKEKEYSELVKQVQFLRRIDWIDQQNSHAKMPPLEEYLTPTVFWFLLCAEYFPRQLSANLAYQKTLADIMHRVDRLPIQQVIRVTETFDSKEEILGEFADITKLLREHIRQLRFEKPPANARNSAELKESYSNEDDEYIVNIRLDLLRHFAKLLQLMQEKSNLVETGEDHNNRMMDLSEFDALRVMKKMDLEEVTQMYQFELSEITEARKTQLKFIEENMAEDVRKEQLIFGETNLDFTDMLIDIQALSSPEREYLTFLENKYQQAMKPLEDATEEVVVATPALTLAHSHSKQPKRKGEKQEEQEDLACQVCNDGDYTEDDLIVFCSKCNVSVHQRCYGIPKVPSDDWVCELCQTFGYEGMYLRCALCSERGGAMKPSKIPNTSQMFVETNPPYHSYLRKCVEESLAGPEGNLKESTRQIRSLSQTSRAGDSHPRQTSEEDVEELTENESEIYDFHTLEPFTAEQLQKEPKASVVWTHITCALWIPECYFNNKNSYANVKGIENIDKQRFNLKCQVCQTKNGAAIQCAKGNCICAFHPECARRAKKLMEIRNTDKLAYLVYCERHTPLKLRRQLEAKEKKCKEDILKFCRAVEKFREIWRNSTGTTSTAIAATTAAAVLSGGAAIQSQSDGSSTAIFPKKKKKSKTMISAKHIRKQITQSAENAKKEEHEFIKSIARVLIPYIEANFSAEGSPKAEGCKQSLFRFNGWLQLLMKTKDPTFWQEIQYNNMNEHQIFARYRKMTKDQAKKLELKAVYMKELFAIRNIKTISKEEKQRQKVNAKLEKINKKQEKIKAKEEEAKEKEKAKEKAKAIAKKSKKEKSKKYKNKKELQDGFSEIEDATEQSDQVYCVCKRRYKKGDLMFACERCDEWYHVNCVGYIGTMDQAESLDFICKFCDAAEGDLEKSSERKLRYGHLFVNFEEPNYDAFKAQWEGTQQRVKHSLKNKVKKEKEEDSQVIQSEKKKRKRQKVESNHDEPALQKKRLIQVGESSQMMQNEGQIDSDQQPDKSDEINLPFPAAQLLKPENQQIPSFSLQPDDLRDIHYLNGYHQTQLGASESNLLTSSSNGSIPFENNQIQKDLQINQLLGHHETNQDQKLLLADSFLSKKEVSEISPTGLIIEENYAIIDYSSTTLYQFGCKSPQFNCNSDTTDCSRSKQQQTQF